MRMKKFIFAVATVAALTILHVGYNDMSTIKAATEESEASLMDTDDYTYRILDDDAGTIQITKYTGSDTNVVIPDTIDGYTVTSIAYYNVFDSNDIQSITISANITYVGESAFSCSNMKNIYVDSDNECYTSVNGVLYSKDKTVLEKYPEGRSGSFSVPDGVTSIGYNAFFNCTKLTGIVISDSVTSIKYEAFCYCTSLTDVILPSSLTEIESEVFWGCDSLESVTIPDSVTKIGESAFSKCSNLDAIYFQGSKNQWSSITFGGDWNYNCPDDMLVYYIGSSTDDYTGIVKASDGKWYYMVNGVRKSYTGIVKNSSGNGKWYYVKNGVFTSYNGIVKNSSGNGKWYYVKNGVFTSYNGIVKNSSGNGKWYYVKNGVFTSYNGIVKNTSGNGKWYYVKNGVFSSVTGLVKNTSGNGKWYYVKNGVFTTYTGKAKIAGSSSSKTYKVVKGLLSK